MSASLFYKRQLTIKEKDETQKKRVCFRLKEARLSKNISLEEISKKTKINKSYLEAIEECRFKDLKFSSLYQKNFIRKYAEAIGINPIPLMNQYSKEEDQKDKTTFSQKNNISNYNYNYWISDIPKIIKYFLASMAIFGLIFYLGAQIKNTLEPPPLTLISPEEGFITNHNEIKIIGQTKPEINVTINGKSISNNEQGSFSETISLSTGINTIVVRAENKHQKISEETIHIIFKQLLVAKINN